MKEMTIMFQVFRRFGPADMTFCSTCVETAKSPMIGGPNIFSYAVGLMKWFMDLSFIRFD